MCLSFDFLLCFPEIENISGVDTDSERLVEQISEELAALTQRDSEVDNELQELDIVSWADKLQIEIHYTKTLQVVSLFDYQMIETFGLYNQGLADQSDQSDQSHQLDQSWINDQLID